MLLTEDKYVGIWRRARSSKRWRALISQSVIAGVILALSFLSVYTIALGAAIAVFFIYLGLLGFMKPPMLRKMYRDLHYPREPITYSLNRSELSLKSSAFQATISWNLQLTWQISGSWLILRPNNFPELYFPMDKLKQTGIYNQVMQMVKKHGREFY